MGLMIVLKSQIILSKTENKMFERIKIWTSPLDYDTWRREKQLAAKEGK